MPAFAHAHTHHTHTYSPYNGFVKELRCCNTGKNADGFDISSTASEIAAGLGKRLDGKLVIVTGASAGIGKESAKAFYETGATVVMACRNEAKARAAMQWIEETAVAPKGKGKLVFVPIDLASLESTKKFADAITKMSEPLAVLMCNAGIMTPFLPSRSAASGVAPEARAIDTAASSPV